MKLSKKNIQKPVFLIAVFACLLWFGTFLIALSDCTIQQVAQFKCTDFYTPTTASKNIELTQKEEKTEILKIPSASENEIFLIVSKTAPPVEPPPSASGLKGQFGDFFGVLYALFGALTIVLVYSTFGIQKLQLDHSNQIASEQQLSARYERYLSEIAAATNAYNTALGAILVPSNNSKEWAGRHGLYHLWHTYMILPGLCSPSSAVSMKQLHYPLSSYIHPETQNSPSDISMWSPLRQQFKFEALVDDSLWSTEQWVRTQVNNLSKEVKASFATSMYSFWNTCYDMHKYQLDALFRSWYHVEIALQTASSLGIDSGTEWRAASRFRAQLSAIELQFLLANQLLARPPGYPRACAISEYYSIFDNLSFGLDPILHMLFLISTDINHSTEVNKIHEVAFSSELNPLHPS